MDLPLDKKTVENQDWATGPLGRGAVAGRGQRADGPSGRWVAGPSRAVGRGPLGRGPAFSKTRYFPLINQHLFRGGQKKNPEMIRGASKK